jgi:hypothetical protein
MTKIQFTSPVGRLVMGNLYDPRTTAFDGSPLVYKHGAEAGKPRVEYFIGLAIAKNPAHNFPLGWANSDWGKALWTAGHAFMSSAGQLLSFKWKVDDGDVPKQDERTGAVMSIREGHAGCWILKLTGSFAPKLYSGVGAADPKNPPALLEKGAINLGDYIQVFADTEGNGAVGAQAGIYVNHRMVCLVGYGKRILVGPDVGSAGFGGQPLPSGASLIPIGGFQQQAAPGVPTQAPQAPSMPPQAPPGYGMPPQAPSMPPQAPPGYGMPPGTPPNYAFIQPPGMPAPGAAGQPSAGYPTPPAMPASPVAPGYPVAPTGPPLAPGLPVESAMTYPSSPRPPAARMTPAATGIPYEAWRAQNWTDEMLIAQGKMLPA